MISYGLLAPKNFPEVHSTDRGKEQHGQTSQETRLRDDLHSPHTESQIVETQLLTEDAGRPLKKGASP